MLKISGKSICSGIAYGKIKYYEKKELSLNQMVADDSTLEWNRFNDAREIAKKQITELYEKTVSEVGKKEAAIFEVHQMLLYDDAFNFRIKDKIEHENLYAEYAVSLVRDIYAKQYADMSDAYLKERVSDIQDICNRIIGILLGENDILGSINEPVIIVAKSLYSSDIMQLNRANVLGFVLEHESEYSHVAILAKMMNIPVITELEIDSSWNEKIAVVDGESGTVIIEPDEKILVHAKEKKTEQDHYLSSLEKYKDMETVTKEGRKIDLFANISCVEDADIALDLGAEGIGLFRSEFLYLEKNEYPSEEEQFIAYKTVAEKLGNKKVKIRTIDIGAEKQAGYFDLDKEENPALGFRAIRVCFTKEDVFRTQLRALLRAGVYGNIAIIFPMIISVDEVKKAKAIYNDCKKQLKKEGTEFRDLEIGVMVETPAAALISEELAKEVDFFSIGTNDLSQYTLAIDRQNAKLSSFFDEHHPAVLKLIKMVVNGGHAAGIKVGVCGELASDLSLTKTFIDMGIDELSVSPSCILSLREQIVGL